MFKNHIYKDNLHHAYFIESDKEIIPPLLNYFKEELNFNISGNRDFYFYTFDNFKIENAREIIPIKNEKSISGGKKFVLIYTNFFTNDAQNALLKMFEETIRDIHFFVICPNRQIFIPTLMSRFYLIKLENIDIQKNIIEKEFLQMKRKDRIAFIKNFIDKIEKENKEREKEGKIEENSVRSEVLNFINKIESILYFIYKDKNLDKNIKIFEKIIDIKKALFLQGSSPKMLFEALALNLDEEIV